MDNVAKLRKELISVFQELRSGELDIKTASEMNNAAGKIIKSVAIQLDYFSLREEKPLIKFMQCK